MDGMEGKEKRLHDASLRGNVDLLNQLMEEDALTLARVSTTCFDETPLHIAAMLGHLDFAQALVHYKPELAAEVDCRGSSPLHLASANGYVGIVKLLLQVNSDACLARDEEGRTPLHLAIMKGRVDVAEELIRVAESTLNATGQMFLHLAVKYNRSNCLKMPVELAGESQNVLNARDNNGNTILHLAASLKQTETVKYLLEAKVTADAVNSNGLTALDMVENMPRDLKVMEIRESLLILPRTTRIPRSTYSNVTARSRQEETWADKKFSSLTIAATVIASMAYQAILNPPGGIWTDASEQYAPIGTSIFSTTSPVSAGIFWACNTISFICSLSVLFLLVSGLRMEDKVLVWVLMVSMWITITSMAISYLVSMAALEPTRRYILNSLSSSALFAWLVLLFIVILVYFVRFFVSKRRKSQLLRRENTSV